jgi:hypothetical protein
METITAILNAYIYDDTVPFKHYAASLDGYDFYATCELEPSLINLFQNDVVQPILFTGDHLHDDMTWAYLKGYDEFASFIEAAHKGIYPAIMLIPRTYASLYRTKFRKYGIHFCEYGLRKSISNKFCRLGIYENVPGAFCEIIEEPECHN